MSGQWHLFLAALRFVARGSGFATPTGGAPLAAMRYLPLAGILIGALGGAVYWLAAQVWPTSIAVVLSLFAITLLTASDDEIGAAWNGVSGEAHAARPRRVGGLERVFVLLIQYNTLMALSAARLPFSPPADLTLGLILIAGQAVSRALVVSIMATESPAMRKVSAPDLAVALSIGLAPAAVLGIPGLIGLAAAIVMRLGLAARGPPLRGRHRQRLAAAQRLTESCFYLGTLATWKYI